MSLSETKREEYTLDQYPARTEVDGDADVPMAEETKPGETQGGEYFYC